MNLKAIWKTIKQVGASIEERLALQQCSKCENLSNKGCYGIVRADSGIYIETYCKTCCPACQETNDETRQIPKT